MPEDKNEAKIKGEENICNKEDIPENENKINLINNISLKDNNNSTNQNIVEEKKEEIKNDINKNDETEVIEKPKDEINKDKINNEEMEINQEKEKEKENKEFEEYENWADAPIDDSSDDDLDEEEELNKSKDETNKDKENNISKSNDNLKNNSNNIEINNNIKETNKNEEEQKQNENSKEDIQKLVNAISLDNYHQIKNKLKLLLNNNTSNQEYFIDFVYKYSLEQLSYQKIYSNLFKDIYSFLHANKNNLKFFRKKIIEKCKQNLINKKICEDNRTIINNNISLIAELINSKIFPKKAGLKCLKYLISKYEKYSELNKNNIKYMYLECVLILLNIFCGNIYNYQKERTHNEFDEEIKKIVEKLNNVTKDEKNKDIPLYTKHLLLKLIEKADKSWELPSYEKEKYESHFKVFNNGENINNNLVDDNNEENNKSFNDSSFIKQDEYDKSFEEEEKKEDNNNKNIFNDGIEREIDKQANNKYYTNKFYNNQNKNDFYYKGKYNQNNNDNTNKTNGNDSWRQGGDKYNNNTDYRNNKNNYYNNQNNDNNNNYYKYNSNNINNNNIINSNYYKYNSSNSNNINNSQNNNNYYYKYSNNSNNSNNFKKFNNYNSKYSKNTISDNLNSNDSFYSNSNSNIINLNNSTNNTYNMNNSYNQINKRNNYGKIILNNLKQFKRHLDNKNNINNFNWNDINELIVNTKIGMNDFLEGLIDSCLTFTINNNSFYYDDLYIKSIFNFYFEYFDENDVSDIKDVVVKHLKKLGNNLTYDKNFYLEDIWVMILYYLINNRILNFADFNIFNKEYNNIKRDIANVLNKIVEYNNDNQNYYMKELKKSKFYNDNKKMFEKF